MRYLIFLLQTKMMDIIKPLYEIIMMLRFMINDGQPLFLRR